MRGLGQSRHRVVIGHAHRADAGAPREIDERRRIVQAIGRGCVEVKIDHASGVDTPARLDGFRLPGRTPASFAGDEVLVLADEQLEVLLLLGGKLHEDLFAFRVFEPFAVLLEELMRSALALDADEQRLLIVDALGEPFRPLGEQAVCRALEKQEGGTRRSRPRIRACRDALSPPRPASGRSSVPVRPA